MEEKNAVLEAIKKRRSVRKYREEQVPEALLEQILEAGRYAPSGGNSQSSHFIVIQKPQALAELRALVQAEFAKMEITENTYQSIRSSISQSRKGNYDFCFGAPTLIVMANKQGYGNALPDCAVALENMMLMAVTLDLGSCWINQLRWLNENPAVRRQLYTFGLAENEDVCGGLALGYPAQAIQPPLPRTGNPVTFVR